MIRNCLYMFVYASCHSVVYIVFVCIFCIGYMHVCLMYIQYLVNQGYGICSEIKSEMLSK